MKFLAVIVITLSMHQQAFAQAHIGNGGDPLMMIFDQARSDASHILNRIAVIGTPATIDIRVRDFLNETSPLGVPRMVAMAKDIEASPHRWREGDVGFNRCAVTNKPGDAAAVYLSVDKCREIFSYSVTPAAEAIKTLIHESVHHFGVSGSDDDEAFATKVAENVFKIWIGDRRSQDPHWDEINVVNAPAARFEHTAVWTGRNENNAIDNKVIVWGGCNLSTLPNPETCSTYLNSGSTLNIDRDPVAGTLATSWQEIDESSAPIGRKFHTAVWTGNHANDPDQSKYKGIDDRMIIFGGCSGIDGACNHSFAVTACSDGSSTCNDQQKNNIIYNPGNNIWSAASTANSPEPRIWHTANWADNEMLVWGGLNGHEQAPRIVSGGSRLVFSAEHPQGNWITIETTEAPAPRYGHTAVWTGKSLIVWGGCARHSFMGCTRFHNDGGVYTPESSNGDPAGWTKKIPGAAFLTGRTGHSMVFTGRYFIVWGGRNLMNAQLDDGGIFDLETNSWRPISNLLPAGEFGRHSHTAVYDYIQGRMIIWGGQQQFGSLISRFPTSTLTYDVTTNTWNALSADVTPAGRKGHTSLWLDDKLVVWGGFGGSQDFLFTGAIFNP